MPKNKSWFIISDKLKKIKFTGDSSFRYSEKFVEKILKEYTKKGDKIFDPFAGFGTTLLMAQKLGRIGIGIEYDKKRYEYIKSKLKEPNKIIHGNSINLEKYNLPKFDFSLTSPPYMRSFDKENPFSNYTKKGGYTQYLKDIARIYSKIKNKMKKNATIIIEIENTFGKNHPMTPLAWDVGKVLSDIFYLEREEIFCRNNPTISQTNHSYCLIFRNKN
ncbi:MAG: DNA methyltransferase [Nanoarchaeota archaeon]